MIFPYWEVHLDKEVHWLPLLPITIHGRGTSVDLLALVDSGSEFNVLGLDLADRLNISLAQSTPATLVGFGEHEEPGQMVPVKFQVGRHRWTGPTVFSQAANRRAILGQTGFFAFFTVAFRYRKQEMDIRRGR
jgi:hypothetical protein